MAVKSDQEPAMNKLVEDVGKLRPERCCKTARWAAEFSLAGSSASNGIVERAMQSAQAQCRVYKLALEERWGRQVALDENIMP